MKICMIGTGYVGLVSGTCFSDLGNDVICVDRDKKKIKNLTKGIIPIYEPGLDELVIKNYKNKRLKFSTNLHESIKKSDIIFICVGTPTKKNGKNADLSQIFNVTKEIITKKEAIRLERRIGIGAPVDRIKLHIGKTRRQAINDIILNLNMVVLTGEQDNV
mgnify:CR=1 FL=1